VQRGTQKLEPTRVFAVQRRPRYTVHLSKFESVTCPEPGILGCYEKHLPDPERADPYKIAVEIEL
jgi:hypothetical protein